MTPALITLLFEIRAERGALVDAALEGLNWTPRCAPDDPAAQGPLDDFVHFMSMVVLPHDPADGKSWLLVELCADGSDDEVLGRLLKAIPAELQSLSSALGLTGDDELPTERLLRDHMVAMGTSLFRQPGLAFIGTPGMTVKRIRDEARLAAAVRTMLRAPGARNVGSGIGGSALRKVEAIRRQVFNDPELKWALFSEPVPLLGKAQLLTAWSRSTSLAWAALRDYLWILLLPPMLLFLGDWLWRQRPWTEAILDGLGVAIIEIVLLALFLGYVWRSLREEEDADDPLDLEPERERMDRLLLEENYPRVVQNHLSAQSQLKPGRVRYWVLSLALWAVAEMIRLRSAPGFLDKIGTIHFARWYLVSGSRRLIFLSNYDGSWQSYLEDFIARLRQGLSSLWSNTRDFPRTSNLTKGGAGDGSRFKRWARRQQLSTPVWYTAYPGLTTASIRTNAALRHGLASVSTERKAQQWLSRLGHAVPDELERAEIPTLVFGRLSKLRFAHALVVTFGSDAQANHWLKEHADEVGHGDHDGTTPTLALGFTWAGLCKLGLPEQAAAQFPMAFQQGMGDRRRARVLGDVDACASGDQHSGPRWGMNGEVVHMLCMVYELSAEALNSRVQALVDGLTAAGHTIPRQQRMAPLPAEGPSSEPFGFRDGISQPIIRGTKNWATSKQAPHVVNPGEIVLGYRDNLGQLSATPSADGVDFGRNGSFLVVRHLAQDVVAFDDYVRQQADRLSYLDRPEEAGTDCPATAPPATLETACPAHTTGGWTSRQEWVAAKMIGRWRDGTPLVRWPELPPSMREPNGSAPELNEFMFGKEDRDGLRCPFGAHIRRANPRDSLDPGSSTQVAISNRHRILRVGRTYEASNGQMPGTFFMCLNSDIERQFEFLQQTWLLGPNFHGLENEHDPILGPGGEDRAFSVPNVNGQLRLESMRRFVHTLGGGYFFMPSKTCLTWLAARA